MGYTMVIAKLRTPLELEVGDYVGIPGLSSVARMKITAILEDPDGCWTISLSGYTINLPSSESKLYSYKEQDIA